MYAFDITPTVDDCDGMAFTNKATVVVVDDENDTGENLRLAMAENPFMHVMIQSGYYDGATDYFSAKYTMWNLDPAGRLQFACRLTEKAYGLDNSVYAYAATDADAQQLDDLLWTFRQGSFIPHERAGAEDSEVPVRIGTPADNEHEGDLLINLAHEVPGFAARFARVAEIVGGDEASVQAGRARFKQYRDQGIEPVTHKIGG